MCRYLRRQPPLRIWVLLTVSLPDLGGTGFRASTMEEKINEITECGKDRRLRPNACSDSGRAGQLRLHILNNLLGAMWVASLLWKQMQLLVPMALIQQDFGTCLDRVTAPQPLGPSGPMAQDLLMTIGVRDVDLLLFQAHGVPSLLTIPM